MNEPCDPWMTIRDAAKHIGMSVAFLRKRVRQRKVPFARIGTKSLRFRRADLDRWLEASSCGPLACAAGDHDHDIVTHLARSQPAQKRRGAPALKGAAR